MKDQNFELEEANQLEITTAEDHPDPGQIQGMNMSRDPSNQELNKTKDTESWETVERVQKEASYVPDVEADEKAVTQELRSGMIQSTTPQQTMIPDPASRSTTPGVLSRGSHISTSPHVSSELSLQVGYGE